jgi:acyl-ACP thioesterase
MIQSATYQLYTNEVDCQKKMSIPGLLLFLQEIAGVHASRWHFGYDALREKGQFWVLSKLKVLLHHYPQWHDELRLETWSKEPETLTAYRDFLGYDQHHNHVFSATSAWHILSEQTNRPQRVDALRDFLPIINDKHAIDEKIDKLPPLENITKTTQPKRVVWSDVDMNMHVNNARYVQWVIDQFPSDFLETHRMAEIEVNFLQQARLDDTYYIVTQAISDAIYLVSVVRNDDHKELARVRTVWQ